MLGGALNEVIMPFSDEIPRIDLMTGTDGQVIFETCIDHPRGQIRELIMIPKRNEPQVEARRH